HPRHLTVWDGNRLVAAAPLYVKDHSLGEFVFDQGWAAAAFRARIPYFPKLLGAVPFTPVTGARLLTATDASRPALVEALAAAMERESADRELSSVHVNFCLPDEADALAARGWLRRVGWQYQWNNPGFASFDAYLESLRSKRRNQVRRERRALDEQAVEITSHTGDEIPDALFARMFTLYRTTIDKLPWGQQYLDLPFFRLVGERWRHRLCFIVARQRGEVIAGTFNVRKGDVFYGRYWGTVRDVPFLHFNVCYYAAIEYCIAHGLRRIEPGAGGEFKMLRGFDATPTVSMHWIRHPRLREAIAKFLAQERRAVAHEIHWLSRKSALKRDDA
ncbi:MAG TPA: GNAT family N-acetyltransferase, partial [Candidatus Binatia bacterium]|nr:GNAT family N-acetyltransferase [Candidatus Binatia bacterium]